MKLTYNDARHEYRLDGKRCKSISAVAKIPDDDWALSMWRQRQLLIGIALNPTLAERAAAHHDDKAALSAIIEEALTVAQSQNAAGMGTATHRITERVDLNLPVVETAHGKGVTTAWRRALSATGIEIVPEFIERIVVHPTDFIAGRFDRLVIDSRANRLRVLDVKSGAQAISYPHAIACQLALYANAKLMADIEPGSSSTESFRRMPDVDTEVGLVVHMPNDSEATVYEVDIAAGWQCVQQVILPTLRWRKRTDLVSPVGTSSTNEPDGLVVPLLRSFVLRRLAHLRTNYPAAFESLARIWPSEIATLKQSEAHDEAQLDAILVLIQEVEALHRVPFNEESDPRRIDLNQPTQREGVSA